jgi:hypothetical protein
MFLTAAADYRGCVGTAALGCQSERSSALRGDSRPRLSVSTVNVHEELCAVFRVTVVRPATRVKSSGSLQSGSHRVFENLRSIDNLYCRLPNEGFVAPEANSLRAKSQANSHPFKILPITRFTSIF